MIGDGFPLKMRPREIRDSIYSFMVVPVCLHHELTGRASDWFNPAILLVDRQINTEASRIIYDTVTIGILVDAESVSTWCLKPYVPEAIRA